MGAADLAYDLMLEDEGRAAEAITSYPRATRVVAVMGSAAETVEDSVATVDGAGVLKATGVGTVRIDAATDDRRGRFADSMAHPMHVV